MSKAEVAQQGMDGTTQPRRWRAGIATIRRRLGRTWKLGRFWGTRALAVSLLAVSLLAPTGDRFILTPAEEAAQAHLFSILSWEISNFLDKWTHRAGSFLTGGTTSEEFRAALDRYLSLSEEIERLRAEQRAVAADAGRGSESLRDVEKRLAAVEGERSALRNRVEEYLEGIVSATVRDQGIGALGPFTWPPVDFRLESPPKILVTSPRDEISRLESILLNPNTRTSDAETVESRIRDELDLSAVVMGLGGLATYPNFVRDDRSLFDILEKAAHEWLHAYLFFHPLGFNYNANGQMQTLNETVANVAGKELGELAYTRLTGDPPPTSSVPEEEKDDEQPRFNFNDFMHETRLRADELLAQGRIPEAEAYMEERRRDLVARGFVIRKLNQAWFAFHGTYADTGASVSPIGPQVERLRDRTEDVGKFIELVRGVGTYGEFQRLLDELGVESTARSEP